MASVFLQEVIIGIIKRNATDEAFSWLQEKAALVREADNASQLNLAFVTVPRKTGKQILELTQEEKGSLKQIDPQFLMDDWTVDKLSRIWLLMQLNAADKAIYIKKISALFLSAEMNEMAALYAGLITFEYPEEWQKQCADGIRSNIGIVLEAIMYNNPYPYKYLNEAAWNQLVLKAFFTDKDINKVIGIDERANLELALTLIDYANERWAASRSVNPQLWRLVSKFINASNFYSIKKAFASSDVAEKNAAALACYHSNYEPAKKLLEDALGLKEAIEKNELNWSAL